MTIAWHVVGYCIGYGKAVYFCVLYQAFGLLSCVDVYSRDIA